MKLQSLCAAALLAWALGAPAQPATPQAPGPAASTAAALADGEVRKLDREQAKLTLRHGRIDNLDMPAMTMVFKVADARWLDTLKVGDKVRFAAENRGGVLTVTRIEASR